MHPIWVPFAIPESDQLALQKDVAAGRLTLPKDNAFDVTIKLTDGTVFPRQGRINFADSRVNPSTGSVEYRAELPNADGALKPGQFVRVKLAGAKRNGARSPVPPDRGARTARRASSSIWSTSDKDGKDVAAVRPITLGQWVEAPDAKDGNLWIVDSGLKPGDRVIVDGVAKLRPGAPITLGGGPADAAGGAPPPSKDKDAASGGNAPAKK